MRLWLLIAGGYWAVAGAILILAPQWLTKFFSLHVQNKPFRKWALISLVFGALLLWAAPVSQAPVLIRVLGAMAILKAVWLSLASKEHLNRTIEWWLNLPPMGMRFWGLISLAIGVAVLVTI